MIQPQRRLPYCCGGSRNTNVGATPPAMMNVWATSASLGTSGLGQSQTRYHESRLYFVSYPVSSTLRSTAVQEWTSLASHTCHQQLGGCTPINNCTQPVHPSTTPEGPQPKHGMVPPPTCCLLGAASKLPLCSLRAARVYSTAVPVYTSIGTLNYC